MGFGVGRDVHVVDQPLGVIVIEFARVEAVDVLFRQPYRFSCELFLTAVRGGDPHWPRPSLFGGCFLGGLSCRFATPDSAMLAGAYHSGFSLRVVCRESFLWVSWGGLLRLFVSWWITAPRSLPVHRCSVHRCSCSGTPRHRRAGRGRRFPCRFPATRVPGPRCRTSSRLRAPSPSRNASPAPAPDRTGLPSPFPIRIACPAPPAMRSALPEPLSQRVASPSPSPSRTASPFPEPWHVWKRGLDATREALAGGAAHANRQPARVTPARQGGGEVRRCQGTETIPALMHTLTARPESSRETPSEPFGRPSFRGSFTGGGEIQFVGSSTGPGAPRARACRRRRPRPVREPDPRGREDVRARRRRPVATAPVAGPPGGLRPRTLRRVRVFRGRQPPTRRPRHARPPPVRRRSRPGLGGLIDCWRRAGRPRKAWSTGAVVAGAPGQPRRPPPSGATSRQADEFVLARTWSTACVGHGTVVSVLAGRRNPIPASCRPCRRPCRQRGAQMNVTLNLNRELGHRLRQAAKHRGVSVDAYTAQLLEQHLPGEGRRSDLVAVLQSWMDEEDAGEQRATGDYLVHSLDEDRLSERPLFPAEQKGATW